MSATGDEPSRSPPGLPSLAFSDGSSVSSSTTPLTTPTSRKERNTSGSFPPASLPAPHASSSILALYRYPAYGSRRGTETAPSPPLRVSTRRLQVFSYVLAELSSAATLLPDYTRAVLNLSQRLVGAWQAVTAAAIARTRYEGALLWAVNRRRRHRRRGRAPLQHHRPQEKSSSSSPPRGASAVTVSPSLHRSTDAPAAPVDGGVSATLAAAALNSAKRRGAPPLPSAAASLFDAAAAASSSTAALPPTHKRRRLSLAERPRRTSRPASALRHRKSPSREGKAAATGRGGAAPESRHRLSSPPPLSSHPPPGAATAGAERHAGQAALRQRLQVFFRTLQHLWVDAQDKEDRAGQHVEYLRGLIVSALFQHYLSVVVEQSYHDLVLYRWVSPVLASAHSGGGWQARGHEEGEKNTFRGREKDDSGTEPTSSPAADAPSTREGSRLRDDSFADPTQNPSQHGYHHDHQAGRGAPRAFVSLRRTRQQQAALHISRDLQLLRQLVQRAQITAGPSSSSSASPPSPPPQRSASRAQGNASYTTRAATAAASAAFSSSPTSSSSSSSSSASSVMSKKRQRSPLQSPLSPHCPLSATRRSEAPVRAAAGDDAPVLPVTSPAEALRGMKNSSASPSLHGAGAHEKDSSVTSPRADNTKGRRTAARTASGAFAASQTEQKYGDNKEEEAEQEVMREEEEESKTSAFYDTLHDANPHTPPGDGPAAPFAIPLPLQIFLHACSSFDPTHCAFTLVSRCVILAHHVRAEAEEGTSSTFPAAISPSKYPSFVQHPLREKRREGGEGSDGESDTDRDSEQASLDDRPALFYLVIARRVVGACAHRALCFGNHRFIFVRCKDTGALIREVMLGKGEEEEEEEEDNESGGSTVGATGRSHRSSARSPTRDRPSEDDESLSTARQAHRTPPQQHSGVPAERTTITTAHAVPVTHHSLASTEGLPRSVPRPLNPIPAPPSSSTLQSRNPRTRMHISALTSQDAERLLSHTATLGSGGVTASASPHQLPTPPLRPTRDTAAAMNHASSHVASTLPCPLLDGFSSPPALSLSRAVSTLSDASSHHTAAPLPAASPSTPAAPWASPSASAHAPHTTPTAAVDAAARLWGRHMRQTAWSGTRPSPPPFVSTDATDLQSNPALVESAAAPPLRHPRSSPAEPASFSMPPARSPTVVETRPGGGVGISNSSSGEGGEGEGISSAKLHRFASAQLEASVHSPLHLTPLPYHSSVPSGLSDRQRAPHPPPPLVLSPKHRSLDSPTEQRRGRRHESSVVAGAGHTEGSRRLFDTVLSLDGSAVASTDAAGQRGGRLSLPTSADAPTPLEPSPSRSRSSSLTRSPTTSSPPCLGKPLPEGVPSRELGVPGGEQAESFLRADMNDSGHRGYDGAGRSHHQHGGPAKRSASTEDEVPDTWTERGELQEGEDSDDDAQPQYLVLHSALCSCVQSRTEGSPSSSGTYSTATRSAATMPAAGPHSSSNNSTARPFSRKQLLNYRLGGQCLGAVSVGATGQRDDAMCTDGNADLAVASGGADEGECREAPHSVLVEQPALQSTHSGQGHRATPPTASTTAASHSQGPPPPAASSSMRPSSAVLSAAAAHTGGTPTPPPTYPMSKARSTQPTVETRDEETPFLNDADKKKAASASPLPASSRPTRQETHPSDSSGGRPFHGPNAQRPAAPPAEPSEGDMAFAAELYARLQFWSLRGQDRTAYIDPSWLPPSHVPTAQGDNMKGEEGDEEEALAAEAKRTPSSAVGESGHDGLPSQEDDGRDGQAVGRGPVDGVVSLPLKLLHYTAGTIQIADEAALAAADELRRRQRRKAARRHKRARHPDAAGTAAPAPAEGDDKGLTSEGASGQCPSSPVRQEEEQEDCSAHRPAAFNDAPRAKGMNLFPSDSDDGDGYDDEEEEGEAYHSESFPSFTPPTAINARGQQLLFEALSAATEVVVCAVRESRAHAGYHDTLHQRCPPLRGTRLATAPVSPQRSPGNTHANHEQDKNEEEREAAGGEAERRIRDGVHCSSTRTAAAPSPASGAAVGGGGALVPMTRPCWALMAASTAAAAASQGCTFPVPTGTLSQDERCPFAFDTHRHLGACATVRWSQGSAAVEEGEGGMAAVAGGTREETELRGAAGPGGEYSLPHQLHSSTQNDSQTSWRSRGSDATVPPQQHGTGRPTSSPASRVWRWPLLPSSDEKQWRCELLKSEFRLARSRCLDALLVDRVNGKPLAAITLEPRSWTELRSPNRPSFPSPGRSGGGRGGSGPVVPHENTDDSQTGEREKQNEEEEDKEGGGVGRPDPLQAFGHPLQSAQEVVQRTAYVVTGFTHYIAQLWRHLRDEKAVLVDMDRTLLDNAVTVRSAAERQRQLVHVRRAVSAAEGHEGAVNPCLLLLQPTPPHPVRHQAEGEEDGEEEPRQAAAHRRRRHSSAKFSAPPFCFGGNDAAELTYDEVMDSGCYGSRSEEGTCGWRASSSKSTTHGSLLRTFLARTAAQRESLGTLHYEECGAVTYTTGSPAAAQGSEAGNQDDESNDDSNIDAKDRETSPSCAPAGSSSFYSSSSASAHRSFYSDLVYVRPGVRQFLFTAATQWNIPLVLVTKSTRSRTEAILRHVLDPHRILFPDVHAYVVTADEMLADDATLGDGRRAWHRRPASPSSVAPAMIDGRGGVEAAAQWAEEGGGGRGDAGNGPTAAERITSYRKSAQRTLQATLDGAALAAARRAWRTPQWCDVPSRLPRPRSIAVVDDAPQVWEEVDWPATVTIAPYSLSRVDPLAYFGTQGYMSALVLSCLYGSKCLVCSAGEWLVRRSRAEDEGLSPPRTPRAHGQARRPSSSTSAPTSPSPSARGSGDYGVDSERWPHCVCVCPREHLDDWARAEERGGGGAGGGVFGHPTSSASLPTSTAAAAAASMSAQLVELLLFSRSPGAGDGWRLVSSLLLMPVAASASGPAAAAGVSDSRQGGAEVRDEHTFPASEPREPTRVDDATPLARTPPRRGVEQQVSSAVEDVLVVGPCVPSTQSDGRSASQTSEGTVEDLVITSKPRRASPARDGAPPPLPAHSTRNAGHRRARGQDASSGAMTTPRRGQNSQQRHAPSSSSSSSFSSAASSRSATPASPVVSSSLSSISLARDLSQDMTVSPYLFASSSGGGGGGDGEAVDYAAAAAAADSSVPATPTSFLALRSAWSSERPPAESVATRGVADGAMGAVAESEDDEERSSGFLAAQHETRGATATHAMDDSARLSNRSFEDVTPIAAPVPHGSNGDADGVVNAEGTTHVYATATRYGVRSSAANNIVVEDVLPLEARARGTMPSQCCSSSSTTTVDAMFPASRDGGGTPASGTSDVESVTAVAPSHFHVGDMRDEEAEGVCGQVWEGELQRPQRRRLEDSGEEAEDVVPL